MSEDCHDSNTKPPTPTLASSTDTQAKCKWCGLCIRRTNTWTRNEWEHENGLSWCDDNKRWAWPASPAMPTEKEIRRGQELAKEYGLEAEKAPLLWRKKPVVIEAVQYDGTNRDEIKRFTQGQCYLDVTTPSTPLFMIRTLEGEHVASVGDYIIKGVKGEFYPCKPDIFTATYQPAAPSEATFPACETRVGWNSSSNLDTAKSSPIKVLAGLLEEAGAIPVLTCPTCGNVRKWSKPDPDLDTAIDKMIDEHVPHQDVSDTARRQLRPLLVELVGWRRKV